MASVFNGIRRLGTSLLLVCTLILATAGAVPGAADSLHLLGFVESSCDDSDHCFELRVKPEFQSQAGEYIHFYFDADSRIFDPENYDLTLSQQNIEPGSHLRLLLQPDPDTSDRYRASFIWIGD